MTSYLTSSYRIVICFIFLSLCGCGYNTIQEQDEQVTAAWSEVLNQYQRRADLIPNLVKTVKAYAEHEKETLEAVTSARAQVSSLKISPETLQDEGALKQFQAAQAGLGGALSRLLAVSERYPDLKADQSFRELQVQLEGTENRITVARGKFIDAVRSFNTTIRRFPVNFTASYFGFEKKASFTVENEKALSTAPEVSFEQKP